MIHLIVDSTCDIPKEFQEKHHIKMIPLQVTIDGKNYLDKVNIETREIYQEIRKGAEIQTALPSYESIAKVYDECIRDHDAFIFLTFSGKMSGTYQFAKDILQSYQDKYPKNEMIVIDSESGALATGLIVMKLAEYIDQGSSFTEVVKKARYLISKVQHLFMLDDLSQLAKGGRISNWKARGGNLLKIKPILDVENGEICLIKQVRGTKRALKELGEYVHEHIGDPNQLIGINYADDRTLADEIVEILKGYGYQHFLYQEIGSVLSTHIGLEAVGVFFFTN